MLPRPKKNFKPNDMIRSSEIALSPVPPSTRSVETRNLSRSNIVSDSYIINREANVPTLDQMYYELFKLQEQVKEIAGLIKQSKTSGTFTLPKDIPIEFPLKTSDELQALENYLNVHNNANNLASFLSTLGGSNITAQTNKILRYLLTNELACKYNFAGQRQNNKKAFSNLILKSVIIRAIKITSTSVTENDIENAIKVWLKHAKQRFEDGRKRNIP